MTTALSDDLRRLVDEAAPKKAKPHAFKASKADKNVCAVCGKGMKVHTDPGDEKKKPPWMKAEHEFTPAALVSAHSGVLAELGRALDGGDLATAKVLLVSAQATFSQLDEVIGSSQD